MGSSCGFVPGAKDGPVEHSFCTCLLLPFIPLLRRLPCKTWLKGLLPHTGGRDRRGGVPFFLSGVAAGNRQGACEARGWLLLPRPCLDLASLEEALALQ